MALSNSCSGVLVSDSYAAYHHYDGPQQRCWVHPCSSQGQALRRDSHDLCALYPDDAPLARWADAVHRLYTRAKAFTHPQARRRTAQLALERQLLAVCRPYLTDTSAAQSRLCRRIQRHIKSLPRTGYGELFVFVAETRTRRTTTPPSAACATWSSVARSAAAPGRKRAPTSKSWLPPLPYSAPGAPKASTLSPPADNCSLPLNPELLRARPTPAWSWAAAQVLRPRWKAAFGEDIQITRCEL